MIRDKEFTEYALTHGLDIDYNQGSVYFNSKATRIAYYKFKGDIECR